MDRTAWLKEVRKAAEQRMDTLYAPIYDQNWGATIEPGHEAFLGRFLARCAPGGRILDAACGTGKYWPAILASGRSVYGTDQSAGMLARAREKFPEVPTEKIGLQEMAFNEAFDGALCVDAMEMVFPEAWRPVLANFWRALKPGGPFYFTVELEAAAALEQALSAAQQQGLPAVYGEKADEASYHYYPAIAQVKAWLEQAGFELLDEAAEGDYHHLLARKPAELPARCTLEME